ncbi:hypothetical protein F443_03474 [Phytophthora nicotianae P1569]|uniref:RxLR effector protein n=3 Tax=Phytophthora nicotianae TaxID=4792 RepID=V9FQ32_PHYNI|nr:hypothetical protein F443_03474 [Phytophthora nicotianae P1569]
MDFKFYGSCPNASSQNIPIDTSSMRLSIIILVLSSVCFAPRTSSAATDQATSARFLRGYETADVEERAPTIKGKWHWGPFSSATWEKMLKDSTYRTNMFKKWDNYQYETIKARIGKEIIQGNEDLAKMILNYVQNHRVYT